MPRRKDARPTAEPDDERPGGGSPHGGPPPGGSSPGGPSRGGPSHGGPFGGSRRNDHRRSDDRAATGFETGRIVWGTTAATDSARSARPARPARSTPSGNPSGAAAPSGFAGSTGSSAARDDARRDPGHDAADGSWNESEHPEHSHDPHEVTVQLDGVGRQTEDWLVQQAKGAPGARTQEAADRPVFVDETGRRSRRYRRIGMAVGLACAVYAMVVLATLVSGNSSAPWLPELGQKGDTPAGEVDAPPLTAESAEPSGEEVSPTVGTTPSVEVPPSQFPGAGVSSVPSATATAPVQSADPEPSADTTEPAAPEPTESDTPDPVTSSPAAPEPSATETATEPSDPLDPPAEDDTGTVAGGPLTPDPVLQPPGPTTAPSSSPYSSSPSFPENVL
ncbi:hypothetical protein [Streptomyces beigongshangae]|uniref:hypothetical protein n=1 Tax=Streptomyces beigongshangae TaxID=2841597 RepID=UPI001C84288B|nr:hypothetical protein [Streptomyces sp. REN17]